MLDQTEGNANDDVAITEEGMVNFFNNTLNASAIMVDTDKMTEDPSTNSPLCF